MNSTRTIAPTVNRAPPRNLHRSLSMSTSLKNPQLSESNECMAMGRRSLLAWCRGDPGGAPAAPSLSVVVDTASSARNSARSKETRCPRAIASAAVTLSHG